MKSFKNLQIFVLLTLWKMKFTCSVSALCLATSKKSGVLVVAGFSGSIAVFGIGALKERPFELPCEAVFKGHHDPDDPGIIALTFHRYTGSL